MGDGSRVALHDVTLQMWGDHVADLARHADAPVVLVGHSRGGVVIGEAAERAAEHILGLIYVTALVVPPGQSAAQVLKLDTTAPMPWLSADGGSIRIPPHAAIPIFFNRCNAVEAARAAGQMCSEPIAPLLAHGSVTWQRWGTLPRAYVEATHDATLTLQHQREIQAAAPCSPVLTLDSDHSPFLSAPAELVEALIRIARGFAPAALRASQL